MLSKTFLLKAILVLAVFLGLNTVVVARDPQFSTNSTGAFIISNWSDLEKLSNYVNNLHNVATLPPVWTSAGKTFILMNDISGFSKPIGTASNPFLGTFDGNGKTITLSINSNSSGNFGVFGYARNATIKKLTSAGEISYSNANGTSYIAGIVAYSSNTSITNCYNSATISVNSISNTSRVGGVVAYGLFDTITNCGNLADICVNDANHHSLGGTIGYVINTTIKYCSNSGTITSTGSRVGGIAGYYGISSSTTTGIDILSNCVNIGTIKGTSGIGGIAGVFSSPHCMNNCSNAGWVSGSSEIGGLIGLLYGVSNIQSCLNTGVVQGTNNVYALIGFRNGYYPTISNCFYDNQMSPYNAIQGIIANPSTVYSLSTSELTQPIIKDALGDAWTIYPDPQIAYNPPANQVYSYPTLWYMGSPMLAAIPARLSNNTCWNNVSSCISLDLGYYYNDSFTGKLWEWPPQPPPHWGQTIELKWQSNQLDVFWNGTASRYGYYHTSASNPNGYKGLSELTISMGAWKKTVPIITTTNIPFKINISDYEMYGFEASEVSPNIVTSNAVMDVSSAVEGYLTVAIFDMSGAKVMEVVDKSVTAQSQTQVELNGLNNLTAGSYMVAVSIGNNVVFRRFVKQ